MYKNLRKIYHNIPRSARSFLLVSALTAGFATLLYSDCSNKQQSNQPKEQSRLENLVSSNQDSTYRDSSVLHGMSVYNDSIEVSIPERKYYPSEAHKDSIEADVYVQFNVKDNKPVNSKILGSWISAKYKISYEDSVKYRQLFEDAAIKAVSDSTSYVKSNKDPVTAQIRFRYRD